MPTAPAKPCRSPRCAGRAVPGSRWCAAHQPVAHAELAATRAVLDRGRGSAHARGYDSRWASTSHAFRRRYPFSAGWLSRTPYWTANLAHQFHALRELAAAEAGFLAFLAPGGAGLRFLEQFPIYAWHPALQPEPAAVTDHIVPHRGDQTLFWAEWNFQALSKRQHDTKTATADGGFRGAQGSPRALRSPTGEVGSGR